jgi:HK97 family phage portal protein
VTTLQTEDGRLLTARTPSLGSMGGVTGGFPSQFPALWSDGERYPNALTDGMDGVLVSYDKIYRSQPILAGVIDMIAYRAATLPLAPFTPNVDGSRTAIPRSDSLATLIRRPRPRKNTVHLLSHIYTGLLVHGNAVVAKLRTHGDPDAPPDMLWPMDWSRMTAYGEPGGEVEWWGTFQFGNQEFFVRAEETIHFAWTSPDGSDIGVSPLEKLGVTIRIEDAAQRYQSANFRNGNRPSNAISFDRELKREALEVNRTALAAFHKGVDRAGSTIMLSGGAKIQSLSMSPVEAALIDQRRLDREEIAIVFGLSGPSLTDSTNSALGNVAERFRAFYRDVLPPYATLVVETFESQLLDPEPAWMDRVVRHDFSDKLRGEPREQAETLKILVEGGLITRDEARYELGKAPEGGNASELTLNSNNQAAISSLETRSAEKREADQAEQEVQKAKAVAAARPKPSAPSSTPTSSRGTSST